MLEKIRSSQKIILFNLIAALPVICLVLFFVLPNYTGKLYANRKADVKHAVETAYGVITHYGKLAAENKMSLVDAQTAAKSNIESLRYDGNEYFWINDMQPQMIMHPIKPDLNGKDLKDFKDPNGKALFVEMVEVAKSSGEGFVNYDWPKPGSDKAVPKTSFVKQYAPWGWILGNGVYINDIDAEVSDFRNKLLIGLLLCSILSLIIAVSSGFHFANTVLGTVRKTSIEVSQKANELNSIAFRMNETSNRLSEAVSEQSAAITESVSSLTEISSMIQTTSQTLQHTVEDAHLAQDTVSEGANVIESLNTAMGEISKSTDALQNFVSLFNDIKSKTAIVNDIAFETRLLSFNASIEAARAGTAGRGFAVVAEEVGKLAQTSGTAATEINGMLEKSNIEITQIVDLTKNRILAGISSAKACQSTFHVMGSTLSKIANSLIEVAAASREQSEGVNQTTETAHEMEKVTQQNSQVAENLANDASLLSTASETLNQNAESLKSLVGQKMGNQSAA